MVLVYFKMAYIEERNKKGRGGGASLLKAKIPEKSNVYILYILSHLPGRHRHSSVIKQAEFSP